MVTRSTGELLSVRLPFLLNLLVLFFVSWLKDLLFKSRQRDGRGAAGTSLGNEV